MKRIVFCSPPFGDEIENPDLRILKIMILYVTRDFWESGSGQAWFIFEEDQKKADLILTFDNLSNKFFLEYDSNDEPASVSLGDGDYDHTVSPFVGGDPLVLPTKWFVSAKETWWAVEEFLQTGKRTDKIIWGARSELKWDYGEIGDN